MVSRESAPHGALPARPTMPAKPGGFIRLPRRNVARGRCSTTRSCSRSFALIWPTPRSSASKVWARLRFVEGVKVSRKRVLRIMRQEHLLSPHRVVQGLPKEHDGKIITAAPDIMWGTDGTKVFTLDEGWC